jgi:CheY-like chemotaxis protein
MIGLINDILDFSRIEAGRAEIVEAPYSLLNVVRDTCRTLLANAQEKGLEMTWEVDPELPSRLFGDAGRLQQVLLNLVGNAIKFTLEGRVHVHAFASGDELRLDVIDTGIGVPPEAQQLIFEAFQQGDGSTSRRFGGTGLGLAISSRLVALMRGRIEVVSETGKGSTFTCILPLKAAPDAAPVPVTDQASAPGVEPQGPLLILLAEDNRVNQLVAVSLLSRRGHQVVVAQNGREVLQRTAATRFDVILMDVQMPEMDGFQATRELRARETQTGVHTPIIAVTAHADREHHDLCIAAGMDLVLTKPFDPERLFSAIEARTRRPAAQPVSPSAPASSLTDSP